MIEFRFEVADVVRLRFAVSPIWELVNSLLALREPASAAVHRAWLKGLSGSIDADELRPVVALLPPRGYMPDFLTPPPDDRRLGFEDELARVRSTSREQIVHDMTLFARQTSASVAAPWLAEPEAQLARLADVLERWWHRALAGSWARVSALLEADIAHRARALTTAGPQAVFADLGQGVRWADGVLSVDTRKDELVELAGRGLLLLPSAFGSSRPAAITRAPWQPTLAYPARGTALLWEERARARHEGLGRVLGASRALLLTALDVPRSTTDLASRAGLSPAATSEHLSALHAAGLVTRRREARRVLYARTPVADELVAVRP